MHDHCFKMLHSVLALKRYTKHTHTHTHTHAHTYTHTHTHTYTHTHTHTHTYTHTHAHTHTHTHIHTHTHTRTPVFLKEISNFRSYFGMWSRISDWTEKQSTLSGVNLSVVAIILWCKISTLFRSSTTPRTTLFMHPGNRSSQPQETMKQGPPSPSRNLETFRLQHVKESSLPPKRGGASFTEKLQFSSILD